MYSLRMLFQPLVRLSGGIPISLSARQALVSGISFLIDSRDTETDSRLDGLSDAFQCIPLSQHHELRQCMSEGLNPTRHRPYQVDVVAT